MHQLGLSLPSMGRNASWGMYQNPDATTRCGRAHASRPLTNPPRWPTHPAGLQWHAREGRPPPQNAWCQEAEYKRLLAMTGQLARSARLVASVQAEQLATAAGADAHTWLAE